MLTCGQNQHQNIQHFNRVPQQLTPCDSGDTAVRQLWLKTNVKNLKPKALAGHRTHILGSYRIFKLQWEKNNKREGVDRDRAFILKISVLKLLSYF